MSPLRVTIIDSGEAGDSTRRTLLEERVKGLRYTVAMHSEVYAPASESEEAEPRAGGDYVEAGDVVFLHANNKGAAAYIQHVRAHEPSGGPKTWLVLYSGGGKASLSNVEEGDHQCVYPHRVTGRRSIGNVGEFLRAVEEGDDSSCQVLRGYDVSLEKKLELLHLCLTPHAAWAERVSALRSDIEKGGSVSFDEVRVKAKWGRGEVFEGSLGEAIGTLAAESDCFSPKYLAVLTGVRKRLLAR